MEKVLLVEDSKVFQQAIYDHVQKLGAFQIDVAASFAEAAALIQENTGAEYFLALVDLTLPDSARGEVVDYVIAHGIPPIVFTSIFDKNLRHTLLEKGVRDYIIKENPRSVELLGETVKRLYLNKTTKVMVVDDSATSRLFLGRLLESQYLEVLQAHSGLHALELLQIHEDTELVITDYQMADMDGLALTREIRRVFRKEDLAIIGMSSMNDPDLLPRFLKGGADDFLKVPFINEEFNCRVTQHLNYIDKVRALREAVIRDALTGLYNRRHLLDVGEGLFANPKLDRNALAAAMIDVDFFKKVNDTYGHDAGDAVLVAVSKHMQEHFSDAAVVARMGGEEFCVLMTDAYPGRLRVRLERVRHDLAQTAIRYNDIDIVVTASIGGFVGGVTNLHDLICSADKALYEAKRTGRNKIIVHFD